MVAILPDQTRSQLISVASAGMRAEDEPFGHSLAAIPGRCSDRYGNRKRCTSRRYFHTAKLANEIVITPPEWDDARSVSCRQMTRSLASIASVASRAAISASNQNLQAPKGLSIGNNKRGTRLLVRRSGG